MNRVDTAAALNSMTGEYSKKRWISTVDYGKEFRFPYDDGKVCDNRGATAKTLMDGLKKPSDQERELKPL